MTQQSDDKAAAAEFIRFMLSEDTQMRLAEIGQMPVLSNLLDTDYIKDHPYYGIFLEQLQTAQARTPHPQFERIKEVMIEAGQAILAEELTAPQALEEAVPKINALLAE